MSDTKLKTCPFCGGTARVLSTGYGYKVYCSNPDCRVSPQSWGELTYEAAIEAWNRRAERKTGRWINHRNDNGHNIADCCVCGNAIQWFDDDVKPRYCCMCGSFNGDKMDGRDINRP